MLRALSIAGGALLLLATAMNVMRTLVVPRGLVPRISWNFDALLRKTFRNGARLGRSYEFKDRVLSYEGPFRLMGLLFVWLGGVLLGFALISLTYLPSFAAAVGTAASSMFPVTFTLGNGDPLPIRFLAAGATLVLVTLQIAYLPTLYAAFNRRETLVTQLSSRTGQPPWGPEVLARHALINNLNDMPQFFRDWEVWAADLAESHTNYPVLLALRAPHPMRSWVVALNSVLDAAALYLALAPRAAPSQANAFIRMGYSALREIAAVMRIDFDPDPLPDDPIELTYPEFREAVAMLDQAGFPRERSPEEAWIHFHGWRVNYETLSYTIADRLIAPPGLWSGHRKQLPGVVFPPERPRHRHPEDETSHVHEAMVH